MSVHFSPSFCTRAPPAGPGAYCERSFIFLSFFSLAFSSLLWIDFLPCGRGDVRDRRRDRTRSDGTELAMHPAPEVVQVLAGRDGVVRPRWIRRNRRLAVLANVLIRSAAAYEAGAQALRPTVVR